MQLAKTPSPSPEYRPSAYFLPQMDVDFERLRAILPYTTIVLAGYGLYRAYTSVFPATALNKLPGPSNGHRLLGHLPEIWASESAGAQQGWADQYGHVVAYKGFLNVCPAFPMPSSEVAQS
jgi:hypothetical protein